MYTFETCQLDPARFELHRAGVAVHVEPQVFDVLVYLLAHRDRVVTKTELLDAIWGDRFVSDSTLTSRLKAARRAIGDDGRGQRLIATVHGVGYRFVGAVTDEHPAPDSPARAARKRAAQEIRYCTLPGRGPDRLRHRPDRDLRWSRRRTGSRTSTSSGTARSGRTGSTRCRRVTV